jgi:hypothetical protein
LGPDNLTPRIPGADNTVTALGSGEGNGGLGATIDAGFGAVTGAGFGGAAGGDAATGGEDGFYGAADDGAATGGGAGFAPTGAGGAAELGKQSPRLCLNAGQSSQK